jgi:hypothetical protein
MVVIALGSRSRVQHTFDLLKSAAHVSKQHSQLALLPQGALQFVQERANRLNPSRIRSQVANLLPPVRSPTQFEIRTALLPVFPGNKTLARQRLEIRRRQAEAGQRLALNGAQL